MKLHYNIESCIINFDDLVDSTAFKTCKWYHKFPFFNHKISSVTDWFKKKIEGDLKEIEKERVQYTSTVRACPGIRNYLRRAIIFKTPSDILIDTKSDGSFAWEIPECFHTKPWNLPAGAAHCITWHPREQYDLEKAKIQHTPSENIFKNKINIKFQLPILFASSKPVTFISTQALYHADNPFQVMNGNVTIGNKWADCPINVLFPRIDETYFIKAGTPLAYFIILDQYDRIEFVKEDNRAESPFLRFGRKSFMGNNV